MKTGEEEKNLEPEVQLDHQTPLPLNTITEMTAEVHGVPARVALG